MKDPIRKIILESALSHYGKNKQIIKTIEECSELIQALSKYILMDHIDSPYGVAQIIEELADVEIMISQMSLLFGQELVANMVSAKTQRLSFRIANEMSVSTEPNIDCSKKFDEPDTGIDE